MPLETTAPAPNGATAPVQTETEAPPPVETQNTPTEMSRAEKAMAILNGTIAPEGEAEKPPESPPTDTSQNGAPKEAQEKPAPKKELLSKSFAELARRERELRLEREKLKQEPKATPKPPDGASEEELNLWEAIAGLTPEHQQQLYQALTDRHLTGQAKGDLKIPFKLPSKAPPPPSEEELLKKLEEHPRFKEMAQQVQQLSGIARRAEENQFKAEVRKLAEGDEEKYGLFLEKGGEQHVWDILNAYYAENGTLPGDGTLENARQLAVEHVQAVLQQELDAWLKTKAAQRKLASAAPKSAAPGHETTGQKTSAAPLRTLSNSMAGAPPRASPKRTTPEERAAEALRILSEGG